MTVTPLAYCAVLRNERVALYESPTYAIEGLFGLVGEQMFSEVNESTKGPLLKKIKKRQPLCENRSLEKEIWIGRDGDCVSLFTKDQYLYRHLPVVSEELGEPQPFCNCIDTLDSLPQETVVECPHAETFKLAAAFAISVESGADSVMAEYMETSPVSVSGEIDFELYLPYAPLLADPERMVGALSMVYVDGKKRSDVDWTLLKDDCLAPELESYYSIEALPEKEEIKTEAASARAKTMNLLSRRGFRFSGVVKEPTSGEYCWKVSDSTGIDIHFLEGNRYALVKTLSETSAKRFENGAPMPPSVNLLSDRAYCKAYDGPELAEKLFLLQGIV